MMGDQVPVSSKIVDESSHLMAQSDACNWHHNKRFQGVVLINAVKPVLNGHSKIDKTEILMTNGSLMKV